MRQSEVAKGEQILKFRLAATERELEKLLKFGGWSNTEARHEIHRMKQEHGRTAGQENR